MSSPFSLRPPAGLQYSASYDNLHSDTETNSAGLSSTGSPEPRTSAYSSASCSPNLTAQPQSKLASTADLISQKLEELDLGQSATQQSLTLPPPLSAYSSRASSAPSQSVVLVSAAAQPQPVDVPSVQAAVVSAEDPAPIVYDTMTTFYYAERPNMPNPFIVYARGPAHYTYQLVGRALIVTNTRQ